MLCINQCVVNLLVMKTIKRYACDEEHKKVCPDVPIISFMNNRNLKSHLVRDALPDINEIGRPEPCRRKRPPCQLCSNMKNFKYLQK